jgi:hypothetical protein
MKSKRFRGIAAVLAVALAGLLAWPAVTASQIRTGNAYYYFFQVQNEYEEPFTADGFANCSIYSTLANGGNTTGLTHSAATLAQGTGVAGPLYSNTNGIIHWYSAYTDPVDVVCYTKGGDSGRKTGMTIRDHRLKIDTSGVEKVVRFPFVSNTAPTGTGIYIPAGAIVTNLAFNIVTVGATPGHINVGFGGNHGESFWNALANRVALSTSEDISTPLPGFKMLRVRGGVGTHPQSANHLGLLLRHAIVDVGTSNGSSVYNGGYMVHTTGGLEVTYNTASLAPVGGHGFVFFRMIHVGARPAGY